jgi:uncharacterized pyridoxamine 5'-phosphate oxidase family protein
MENLIKTFTCVLRHNNNAGDIIISINALLDGTALAGDISDNDRLGILDLPDTATQEANVVTVTSLSRAQLLERAALSPSELSTGEIKLLKQRFWLDPTAAEESAQRAAQSALAISEEEFYRVTDQLKKARTMLYHNNEEAALLNAENEEWQRIMAATKEERKREVESRLPFAQPWIKRLWDEDHAEKDWGYAVFFAPEAAANEEYAWRYDGALWNAHLTTGCAGTISSRWRLQHLDWPDSPALKQLPHYDYTSEQPIEIDAGPRRVKRFTSSGDTRDIYTTSELEARFQALRQHFMAVRDYHSERQSTAPDTQLQDGILRNVFLVIDQQCVESLLSPWMPGVDDAWVYAVDPDYLQHTTDAAADEYRGYMRVRLQQLVNNFFDARRFHENEFSMEELWRVAQSSRHCAFVSVKEEERKLWTTSRLVGSALRPEGVVRSVVKLPV